MLGSLFSYLDIGVVFFFSSRRRHTRCLSDWSSDVCSSDLVGGPRRRRCRAPERAGRRSAGTNASFYIPKRLNGFRSTRASGRTRSFERPFRRVPTELKRSLRIFDGLAMVIGIMVGSGIFRTPGEVARQLGRPWLTLVAWLLGGLLAFCGALCFAELATRYPKAGGKYVYAREAFGPRAGFVVGWVEGLAIYPAAIAALGVVTGEFVGRLGGWPAAVSKWIGVLAVALFVAINIVGVTSGRWVQNLVTSAKVDRK